MKVLGRAVQQNLAPVGFARRETWPEIVARYLIEPANIVGFWPLWETSGTVAESIAGPAGDGANNGATVAGAFFRGVPIYSFDGVNDRVNIYSAALAANFNPLAGTLVALVQPTLPALTDGAIRMAAFLGVDGSNAINIWRIATNNIVQVRHRAGAVSKTVSVPYSVSEPRFIGMTWEYFVDPPSSEMKAYADGVQVGTTQTGLGVWAGALATTLCNIGATNSTSGSEPWLGNDGLVGLWNKALTPAQMAVFS